VPHLGAHIRELRTAIGLTQAQLADGHFTKALISQVELGRVRPSPHTLEIIAHRLGTTTDALLADTRAHADAMEGTGAAAAQLAIEAARAELAAGLPDRAQHTLDVASRSDERVTTSVAFLVLRGEIAASHGRAQQAFGFAADACAAADSSPSADDAVQAHLFAGRLHLEADRLAAALSHFDRAAEVAATGAVHPLLRARTLNMRGLALAAAGDTHRALEVYREAEQCVTAASDLRRLVGEALEEADAARRRDDVVSAAHHVARGAALVESLEIHHLVGQILHGLGAAYAGTGEVDRGRELQHRARTVANVSGDVRTEALALERLAACELEQGDARKAAQLAEEAAELAGSTEAHDQLALSLLTLARTHEGQGDSTAADNAFLRAIAAAPSVSPRVRGEVYLRYGQMLRERGDFEAAAGALEMAASRR